MKTNKLKNISIIVIISSMLLYTPCKAGFFTWMAAKDAADQARRGANAAEEMNNRQKYQNEQDKLIAEQILVRLNTLEVVNSNLTKRVDALEKLNSKIEK